jgi:hypothetical protein
VIFSNFAQTPLIFYELALYQRSFIADAFSMLSSMLSSIKSQHQNPFNAESMFPALKVSIKALSMLISTLTQH